jgi:fructose-bisphosphate aldolase class II
MKFIPSKELLSAARQDNYAVPAFNSNGGTYDITRASLEICQELRSPLILQVYEPNCRYRGYQYFVDQIKHLCGELDIDIPVAIQLDHGHSYESVAQAIHAGFTGVMIDGSHELLEKNIALTNEVIRLAHALGVSVEAEVGYVKGNQPKKEKQIGKVDVPEKPDIPPTKTEISEVLTFLENTDVDMLAVSIGTTHGVYKHQTEIDYSLLKDIYEKVSVPLVQHGTCGITMEDLSKLSQSGMSKINFGEPFRFNYIKYFNELTDQMEHLWHPWRIMQEIKNRLKEDMREIIQALGSQNRV